MQVAAEAYLFVQRLPEKLLLELGVFLGATLDDVTKAYGTAYAQNLGLYTYTSGKMTLAFLLENGKVTSIEYAASAS